MGMLTGVDLTWEALDMEKDHMVTYLLYKEKKSIPLIARIRRITEEEVKHQLIKAKSELFTAKTNGGSLLDGMLEMTKSHRQTLLVTMSQKDKKILARQIYQRYDDMENPEDKMVMIWIIGELGITKLIDLVHRDVKHPHGNVRRLVCSAINKIGDEKSVEYLYRALMDSKPQVRQYAAKALGRLGGKKAIAKLRGLSLNPKEKDYVKVAFDEAIRNIQTRLENP